MSSATSSCGKPSETCPTTPDRSIEGEMVGVQVGGKLMLMHGSSCEIAVVQEAGVYDELGGESDMQNYPCNVGLEVEPTQVTVL